MSGLEVGHVLAELGVPQWGVAEVARYRELFPEAPFEIPSALPRAIVLMFPLQAGVLDTLENGPNLLYLHHYRQVNQHLDRAALALGRLLESQGFVALPIAASQTLDAEDLTSHLSHRHMAALAGLGWRGKNNLLVNPRFGSRHRLVTVLTDASVQGRPDAAEEKAELPSRCGGCTACREACPAGAIGDTADAFDKGRCVALLCEFRKIPRLGQRICGLCQKACPHGKARSPVLGLSGLPAEGTSIRSVETNQGRKPA
jgi:epoxyqueuosine reductase QueG